METANRVCMEVFGCMARDITGALRWCTTYYRIATLVELTRVGKDCIASMLLISI